MAECSRNLKFLNLPETNWSPSEYDKDVMQNYTREGEQVVVGDVESCSDCNIINFTSPSHRNSHFQGKKHKAVIHRKKMKGIPLNCKVCCVQSFSSEISANDHFESEKHKKRTRLESTNNLYSPGELLGTDRTKWVICDVCNVQLNSREQLRIHRSSERHLKKIKERESSFSQSLSSTSSLFSSKRESSMSDENNDETNEYWRTTTPKKELFSLANITTGATENEHSKDYTSNKKCNNLENPCNIKSSADSSVSSSGSGKGGLKITLDPSATTTAYEEETFKHSNRDDYSGCSVMEAARFSDSSACSPERRSTLPDETVLVVNAPTDPNSIMKKVPNVDQVNNNNNNTDTTKSNKSLEKITNNNLNVPTEISQSVSDNDSANSSPSLTIADDTITNDVITNIIEEIAALSIQGSNNSIPQEVSTNKTSNYESTNSNNKIQERSSPATASGRPRQKSKTTSGSGSPLSSLTRTDEDEIPMWIEKIEKYGMLLCYFCKLCHSQLNQGAIKNHVEGINHRQKMMTVPIPERELPPVIQDCEDATNEAFVLTKCIPRSYQVELFEKCHSTDSIIFLPTGTGKTLCAAMLISYMLKRNPKRSVLFLVDKVLLVFQQKNYIEEQLNMEFSRFDFKDNDKLVNRKLDIACVCGGTLETQSKPLGMHDIVISTAAFCSNMINQNVLRWADFSFVVVDEAHHCVKNHPFKVIFSTQHATLEKDKRPKVLGLTASPAGQETLEGTINMLVSLSMNMGSAKITIAEDTVEELNKYKSNARLEIEMLAPSNEEKSFNFLLQKYLMQCLVRLAKSSNISNYIDFITTDEKFVISAEKLDELQNAFYVIDIDKDKVTSTSLLLHVKTISTALAVSLEMGIPLALEELKSLTNKDNNLNSFWKAIELGLPCHQIKEMCEKYIKIMDDALWEQEEIMSTVHFLIHKITALIDKQGNNKNTTVLVLVKQRATAVGLGRILKKSSTMQQHNLSTVSLIGHGAGTSTGMNVNDQKRTLEEIKNHLHQVIIATSVAEEGIDLPECSLVITMKPPTSITALVQMRGRARKKNSLFLTICSNEKEKSKIENVLKQEVIMEKATQKLVNYYKVH